MAIGSIFSQVCDQREKFINTCVITATSWPYINDHTGQMMRLHPENSLPLCKKTPWAVFHQVLGLIWLATTMLKQQWERIKHETVIGIESNDKQ